MEWVKKFYSETGRWWNAENVITERDRSRVKVIGRFKPSPQTVLELGSGYGNTAAVSAEAGYDVIGIEISDRFDYSKKWLDQNYPGKLHFVKEDFYRAKFNQKFDVVTYWNGFGIGNDEDQLNLLAKISDEWLKSDGIALIDVQNPLVWQRWAQEGGDVKQADPERGYFYNVSEEIIFNESEGIVTDTWWVTEKSEDKISQTLRCYTISEFKQLLKKTNLQLDTIILEGKEVSQIEAEQLLADENKELHEYLVKLSRVK